MNFETKARLHQEKYLKEVLKLNSYDIYPTMLTDEDARSGYNFYPGALDSVKHRYKNFKGPLYKNLLRSEHIPFNLFGPFQKSCNDPFVLKFFQTLFPWLAIDKIISVDIEKSPEENLSSRYSEKNSLFPEEGKYLNDRTSFDVLITYESSNAKGAIGIEVKYSEKSYPYGETERQRMFSQAEDSLYHKTHHASGIYLDDKIALLREKKLKQLWRNHLLGLKMKQNGDVSTFTSVHMYPAGNVYQEQAANEYLKTLKDENLSSFFKLTYERFLSAARMVLSDDSKWRSWVDYIEKRYIC